MVATARVMWRAKILVVRITLLIGVLLPIVAQALAIETLHFPDGHSQQAHRAPGLTTMAETGLITVAATVPSTFDTENVRAMSIHRPAARPVEPTEYPPEYPPR